VAHSTHEIEIKLRVADAAAARRLLRAAGLRVWRRRVFEDNFIFDTNKRKLRQAGTLLRVRQAAKKAVLTYKGPSVPGKHKSRPELEIEISDAPTAMRILEALGFRCVFRYQKFRTEYKNRGSAGVITLDETPIGCYLEIEGPPKWIDRMAHRLGFRESDYLTASYGRLYQEFAKKLGIEPADMVFTRRTRRPSRQHQNLVKRV